MDKVDRAAIRILFVAHAVAAGDAHDEHEQAIRSCAKALGAQWDVPGEDMAELFSDTMDLGAKALDERLGTASIWEGDPYPDA